MSVPFSEKMKEIMDLGPGTRSEMISISTPMEIFGDVLNLIFSNDSELLKTILSAVQGTEEGYIITAIDGENVTCLIYMILNGLLVFAKFKALKTDIFQDGITMAKNTEFNIYYNRDSIPDYKFCILDWEISILLKQSETEKGHERGYSFFQSEKHPKISDLLSLKGEVHKYVIDNPLDFFFEIMDMVLTPEWTHIIMESKKDQEVKGSCKFRVYGNNQKNIECIMYIKWKDFIFIVRMDTNYTDFFSQKIFTVKNAKAHAYYFGEPPFHVSAIIEWNISVPGICPELFGIK